MVLDAMVCQRVHSSQTPPTSTSVGLHYPEIYVKEPSLVCQSSLEPNTSNFNTLMSSVGLHYPEILVKEPTLWSLMTIHSALITSCIFHVFNFYSAASLPKRCLLLLLKQKFSVLNCLLTFFADIQCFNCRQAFQEYDNREFFKCVIFLRVLFYWSVT